MTGTTSSAVRGAAACGYLTQLTITSGLKRVPATLGTAASYLTVVWGMGLGYFVFHEVPTLLSLLGAALICGSALTLSLVEGRPGSSGAAEGVMAGMERGGLRWWHALHDCMQGFGDRVRGLQHRERGWQALQTDELPLQSETELTGVMPASRQSTV